LGYQLGQVVEWWKNQHFEYHLCPHPQGADVDMVGKNKSVLFIPVWVQCSWLTASQWGQLGGVRWPLCLDQLSGWTASWLQGTRPGSVWSHHPCWSFYILVLFWLLPWWGGTSPLASSQPGILSLDRYKQDRLVFHNHIHISTLRTRTETVFKTLVFSPFNHLTWLIVQENFIVLSCWKSNRSYNYYITLLMSTIYIWHSRKYKSCIFYY